MILEDKRFELKNAFAVFVMKDMIVFKEWNPVAAHKYHNYSDPDNMKKQRMATLPSNKIQKAFVVINCADK